MFKAGRLQRPSWQRVVNNRSARAVLLAVGCVALVSYLYLVLVLHPRATTSRDRELQQGETGVTEQQPAQHPSSPLPTETSAHPAQSGSPPLANGEILRHAVTKSTSSHHSSLPVRKASPPPPASPPPETPEPPHPMRNHPHKDEKYRIHKLPKEDRSPRCKRSGICDGNHECGPDGLGCVTKAEDRKAKVQEAARWTWKGYR